jgi:hypothetical protein
MQELMCYKSFGSLLEVIAAAVRAVHKSAYIFAFA